MTRTKADKDALRARFRARRTALARRDRQAMAARLNQHLLHAAPLRSATCVAGYLAFDGEPDVRFSLTQLHRRGMTVALPVLPDQPGAPLTFRAWTPASPLRPNRFGISEPQGTAEVALADVNLMLIPLVAFDGTGRRLGMGAGLYDRTLARATRPLCRVGVAWAVQRADTLPMDAWDEPLDAVVTDDGWLSFERPGGTMQPAPSSQSGDSS